MPVGDDQSVRAARALALPTRSAILGHLLKAGSLTAKEIADEFSLHPNVARAHLDLLVEAGFLATGVRRQGKGRPAKVYFTWEGEMGTPEDWEVSPRAGPPPPTAEMLPPEVERSLVLPPNPYRLIAAIFVRLVEKVGSKDLYRLAEEVGKEEGRKLVLGYRDGGLDFPAAVRALVEELRRFSPQVQVIRLDHEYAEIETPDCPFRDIALEHSDLVSIIDPAIKEGAMEALGHPSDVEIHASVARGDQGCHESIRRRDGKKSRPKTKGGSRAKKR